MSKANIPTLAELRAAAKRVLGPQARVTSTQLKTSYDPIFYVRAFVTRNVDGNNTHPDSFKLMIEVQADYPEKAKSVLGELLGVKKSRKEVSP
jgi:hypothetical protein